MWFYVVLNKFHQILLLFCYQYNLILVQDYSNLLRGLIFSSDNPLGFHSEIRSVLPIICTLAEILNNFKYHDPHNDFYLQIKLNQINLILLFCLDLLFIQLLLLMLLLFYLNQHCLWIQQHQIYQLVLYFLCY